MAIMDRCRACNGEGSDYNELFKEGVIFDEVKTLGELLSFSANIKMYPDENHLPQHICDDCVQMLVQSYQFKKMVIETDNLLRKENILFLLPEDYDEECDNGEASEDSIHYCYVENMDILISEEEKNQEKENEENVINNCNDERDGGHGDDDGDECDRSDDDGKNNSDDDNDNNIIIEEIPFDNFDCFNDIEVVSTPPVTAAEEEVVVSDEYEENIIAEGSFDSVTTKHNMYTNKTATTADDDVSISHDPVDEQEERCQIKDDVNQHIRKMSSQKRHFKPRKMQPKSEKTFNPDYKCKICQKQLSHFNSYKYHMQLHSNEMPFLCKICDMGFKTRNAFDGHSTTHNPNNPNKCKICGKCYRQSSSLRSHMLKHTGEKPFICPICGKGMTQKSGFKKHMLIHTGEKPHSCDICGRKFRYSSNLLTHKRRHTNEKAHKCLECGKCFGAPYELNRHMNVHTGKGLTCDFCNKIFKTRALFNAHWQSHISPILEKNTNGNESDNDSNINVDIVTK